MTNILHISTTDNLGGSGRSAYRIHTGLRKLGCTSRMLVSLRSTADPDKIRRSAARHLLRTFFNNSMESAVAAMLGGAEKPPSGEELKRMAKLIGEARRRRERS